MIKLPMEVWVCPVKHDIFQAIMLEEEVKECLFYELNRFVRDTKGICTKQDKPCNARKAVIQWVERDKGKAR